MDTVSAIIEGMDRVYRVAPEMLYLAAAQCVLMLATAACLVWGFFINRRIKRAATELHSVRAEVEVAVDGMQAEHDRLIAVRDELRTAKSRFAVINDVEAFYEAVNARAEADMLAGNPITGAHHRALEAEIERHRAFVDATLPPPPAVH